jgi:hypothetical protein
MASPSPQRPFCWWHGPPAMSRSYHSMAATDSGRGRSRYVIQAKAYAYPQFRDRQDLVYSLIGYSDVYNGCVPLRRERRTAKASPGPYGIRHAGSDPVANSNSYTDTDRDSYRDGPLRPPLP